MASPTSSSSPDAGYVKAILAKAKTQLLAEAPPASQSPSSTPVAAAAAPTKAAAPKLSQFANFSTAGGGGLIGWAIVHPFSTLAVRTNLASAQGNNVSFMSILKSTVKKEGVMSLYDGLSAGLLRQVFYSTSRFGLFEVFRDELAKVCAMNRIKQSELHIYVMYRIYF
jgi:hypothetical protein